MDKEIITLDKEKEIITLVPSPTPFSVVKTLQR